LNKGIHRTSLLTANPVTNENIPTWDIWHEMMGYKEEALEKLNEEEPDAEQSTRRAVATEMARLLESGNLSEDIEEQSIHIDYLISRLGVREGEDDPSLKEKWNTWIGEMDYIHEGGYNRYQI
jgi:hypothetical protein